MRKKYVLVSEKEWHDELFNSLTKTGKDDWIRIRDKNDFTEEKIKNISPDILFIPHWSYIIPESIYANYECIVFHMTDLPFGRGGSPLQNLIVRGLSETVISAIKVTKGVDTGDVYLKMPLSLAGTATEIFIRSSAVVEQMILRIINDQLTPVPQEGEVVIFKRRKQEDGNIALLTELVQVYDFIRMLDCEGYPPAFIETEYFRLEFSHADFTNKESVTAYVRIIKK